MGKQDNFYLQNIFKKISQLLEKNLEDISEAEIAEASHDFCILIERILKMKLYQKNPLLVFDASRIDNNNLLPIARGEDLSFNTIKFEETLKRFNYIFLNFSFGDYFTPVLTSLYEENRNPLTHSYKSDKDIVNLKNKEKIVKDIGSLFPWFSDIAKDFIDISEAPADISIGKKYTEEELEEIFKEELKKKLIYYKNNDYFTNSLNTSNTNFLKVSELKPITFMEPLKPGLIDIPQIEPSFSSRDISIHNECPRCRLYKLKSPGKDNLYNYLVYPAQSQNNSYLYKCSNCNLELTEKEYQMSKKI